MTMDVIVLAAGKGTRMNSALPKVLQPLAGRPLLAHVLETARALGPAALHVVVGHGMEAVRTRFDDSDLHWVEQAEQRGTGHAVAQALPSSCRWIGTDPLRGCALGAPSNLGRLAGSGR